MKKKKLSLNWRKCQYLIFLNYKEMSNSLKKSKKEWKQKPNWKEACLSMYLIHTSIMMMFSTEFLLKNNKTKYGHPLWILLSQQYQTRQLLSEMTHFHLGGQEGLSGLTGICQNGFIFSDWLGKAWQHLFIIGNIFVESYLYNHVASNKKLYAYQKDLVHKMQKFHK